MATGQTRVIGGIAPRKSAIPGKVPTGTTVGEIFSNLTDRKLFGYDGSNIFEYGSNSFLNLTGGTVSGITSFTTISATTISGETLYSGSTNLYNIFEPISATTLQQAYNNSVDPEITINSTLDGLSIKNGTGNPNEDTHLLEGLDSDGIVTSYITAYGEVNSRNVKAVTISGNTLYSGTTDLNVYFNQDRAQINTKANRSGDTFTGTVISPSFSATTISGGTLFSGSTNLYDIFLTTADGNDITRVQPGTNISTGGSANFPVVNVISSPSFNNITFSGTAIGGTVQAGVGTFTSLSAATLSGGTILSGSTNLYDIFHQKNGYLLQKAGVVSGSTFSGSPKKAIIIFTTNFLNNNYAPNITGTANRTWTIESKTLSGFTINSNSPTAFNSGEVYWTAVENGEGIK